jgi:hypothetical protein
MTSDDACERVACKALCSAWCRRGRFLPKPHTHQAHAHPRPTHTLSTTPTGKTTRSACLAANALSLNSIRERCCPTSPEHPPTRFERLLPWLRSNYDGRSSSKRSRRRGGFACWAGLRWSVRKRWSFAQSLKHLEVAYRGKRPECGKGVWSKRTKQSHTTKTQANS